MPHQPSDADIFYHKLKKKNGQKAALTESISILFIFF
jgi:hypothetical protein